MVRGSMPRKFNIRWQLMFYDVVVYVIVIAFIVTTYGLAGSSKHEFVLGSVAALAALLICRTLGKVYSMIIRYGGVHVYMRLFATDLFVILCYFPLKYGLGLPHLTSQRWLIIVLLNLLGAVGIRLTERGASFGYNTLVTDMRGIAIMRELGYPVVMDATHSVQIPGGQGTSSGGQSQYVPHMARAAAAVGIDALFLEVHDNPAEALSDGPNMVCLDNLKKLLSDVLAIDKIVRG